jgi:predicted PurR-regulated permease PerM
MSASPAPLERPVERLKETATRTSVANSANVRDAALMVLAAAAILWILRLAALVLVPIVVGIVMSYALEPIVAALVRTRIPRVAAATCVLLGLAAGGSWLAYSLRDDANAALAESPRLASLIRQRLQHRHELQADPVQNVRQAANELQKAAADATAPPPPRSGVVPVQIEQPPINVQDYLITGSVGVIGFAAQLVVILFLVYYLLASGDLYRRKLVKLAPSLAEKKVTLQILEEISAQIELFLVVRLFIALIVGVGTWLGLRLLGLEHAAAWGTLAGVLNVIAYVGPISVTLAIGAAAFLQFDTFAMTLACTAAAGAVAALEGYAITPWLTSRAGRMNTVGVFIGLLFWGWLWGVWGLLLAVPLMMTCKAVCDRVENLKPIGELLGD